LAGALITKIEAGRVTRAPRQPREEAENVTRRKVVFNERKHFDG
jgi:hypothetical protein